MKECRLCLGPHDPAIHQATVRIHQWLRAKLMFAPPPEKVKRRTTLKPFEIPASKRFNRFTEDPTS